MPTAMARRPEPQSWFSPQAVASCGMPAAMAAWRAGFWPCAGGQDLAEDDLVDFAGVDACAGQGFLDRDGAEFVGGHVRECPVEGTDRGAGGAGDDDGSGHSNSPRHLLGR